MRGEQEGNGRAGGGGDCGVMTGIGCLGGALDSGVDLKWLIAGILPGGGWD